MTAKSTRKYGAGPESNSQPLDQLDQQPITLLTGPDMVVVHVTHERNFCKI